MAEGHSAPLALTFALSSSLCAPVTNMTQSANTPPELQVRLQAFEGPLDLLLELIKKHEVDIFDIPISMITDEYLRFIQNAESIDIEVGGEWLELAALLIFIKSRMLLPQPEVEADDMEGEDPREELVQRLIEYQKYKLAAASLDQRPMLERDVFTHSEKGPEFTPMLGPAPLQEASVSELMEALKRLIARTKSDGKWVYEVNSQKLTLRSVILDIAALLAKNPRLEFEALFENKVIDRTRIITTFLALLEMTRLKMIKLFQSKLHGDQLWVERCVVDILEVSQELELKEAEV